MRWTCLIEYELTSDVYAYAHIFKFVFLENETSYEKISFYIFDLFFSVV